MKVGTRLRNKLCRRSVPAQDLLNAMKCLTNGHARNKLFKSSENEDYDDKKAKAINFIDDDDNYMNEHNLKYTHHGPS